VAEPAALSVASGGTQQHYLAPGVEHGGALYLLVGSAGGTAPGLPLGVGLELPLVPDAYTDWTVTSANGGVLDGTFGVLDGHGGARPRIVLPAGLATDLVGHTLHHAAVVFGANGQLLATTNAAALQLVP
jgi:hypothetical protein